MIDQYLSQLRSSDPVQRRQAILALGRAKDPRALGPLAEVYRNDPVPELRDMALKAGRYIKQQTKIPTAPVYQPPTDSPAAAARKKGLNTDAVGRMLESHYKEEASQSSSSGSSWHPYYTPSAAPTDVAQLDARKEKRKAKQRARSIDIEGEEHEATWTDVIIDLLLLFAVHVAGIFVISVVLPTIAADTGMSVMGETADLATALIDGVTGGFITVLYAVVRYGAIFGVGTFTFGGDGSLMGIFHRLVPIETGLTLGYYLLLTVLSLFLIPELMPLGAQFFDIAAMLFSDAEILVIGVLVLVGGILFWMSYEIGKEMKFGVGMGFACLFVGTIAFFCTNCALLSMLSPTALPF